MNIILPAIVVPTKDFGEALRNAVHDINVFMNYNYISLRKETSNKWSIVGTCNLEIIEITADRASRFFLMQRVFADPMSVCMHANQDTLPMRVAEGSINLLFSVHKTLEGNIYSALSYLIVARIPIF